MMAVIFLLSAIDLSQDLLNPKRGWMSVPQAEKASCGGFFRQTTGGGSCEQRTCGAGVRPEVAGSTPVTQTKQKRIIERWSVFCLLCEAKGVEP